MMQPLPNTAVANRVTNALRMKASSDGSPATLATLAEGRVPRCGMDHAPGHVTAWTLGGGSYSGARPVAAIEDGERGLLGIGEALAQGVQLVVTVHHHRAGLEPGDAGASAGVDGD